ncbi:amino acid ABC transporter permease [Endozoicomonas gorgoniicola]|uniref:Amino acid ABC transporter permease n=1 Tax=Endozoicomonas gorgoniicola TaxID=1234144 RepID=A0ABT3N3N3_9GAMM|nr:amino acid ABC transporter permease [Endozoicomonas gorgoniicola]MCW7556242.1 amino acid ABC transporter permease [Endozoicomonas gorgoniicola]
MIEPRKPPVMNDGVAGWLKSRLFSTPLNTLTTLVIIYGLYLAIPAFWNWAVVEATWQAAGSEECSPTGACWAFVNARLNQFTYGFYPVEQQWRVDLFFLQLVVVIGWITLPGLKGKRWSLAYGLLVMPFASWGILYGGFAGLKTVETHLWGGLMLTLLLALCGMIASFPFGIFLALGRRSKLPMVRALSTAYIEIWRGVPLITVLFMASVMLPLFVPENVVFDKLLRALIGIVMFQSAYMAEVVRGGLQAIPRGQYEAFASLGLSFWQGMVKVILPQAIRLVIPGIVNTFITLFKDTSLVLVIGLFDLLAIVQSGLSDPVWLGNAVEGYLFAGLVFWLFCFGMSRYSKRLEKQV